jgi:bacillithiol biosynthesis cysteine-adding enzyme BshC
VDIRRLPWIRRLAADYSHHYPALANFYAGDPADPDAWRHALVRTRNHARNGQAIASVVAAQQRARGAPLQAVEAARRLADPHAVAIVAGQQAGLFGGPLFTIVKALTAIRLAHQIAREHQVQTVAVFWIDAEDHDWDEVRSCTVFDEALTPRAVSLPAGLQSDGTPVSAVRLGAGAVDTIGELERVLPPTEFRQSLLAGLRETYAPGAGMAEAFGRWLERVLGDRGLVVFDASDPAAKPLAAKVFAREVATAGETARRAARAGADLAAAGYHAQVQVQDDSVALFHLNGSRRAIRRQGSAFLVGDRLVPVGTLEVDVESAPASFSPSVLLRPIVQDTLFPTICYVSGPNELAYLGQLKGVYEHFGVPMPLMYPRPTTTLVDSAALRFLNRHRLDLQALQPQDEAGLNELLRAQIPAEVDEAFRSAGDAIEAHMARLVVAVNAIDPTLEGAAKSTRGRMQHDLQTLQGKMIQAAKRRDDTLRRQYLRTRSLVFPGGQPQERTVGLVWFLNQYGPALIQRLHDAVPLDSGRHWVVSI